MNRSKILTTVIILALCVAAVYGAKSFIKIKPQTKAQLEKRDLLRSKGDPSAPLWIVEYADFQCKSCRESAIIMDTYIKKYPKKIFLQARSSPMGTHYRAYLAAIYAECAIGQGKFWPFHDLLFQAQAEWSQIEDVNGIFHGYARSVGMDINRLDQCLKDPEAEKALIKDKEEAASLGIKTTPTFFMNGKMVHGPQGLTEELKAYFKEGTS